MFGVELKLCERSEECGRLICVGICMIRLARSPFGQLHVHTTGEPLVPFWFMTLQGVCIVSQVLSVLRSLLSRHSLLTTGDCLIFGLKAGNLQAPRELA